MSEKNVARNKKKNNNNNSDRLLTTRRTDGDQNAAAENKSSFSSFLRRPRWICERIDRSQLPTRTTTAKTPFSFHS